MKAAHFPIAIDLEVGTLLVPRKLKALSELIIFQSFDPSPPFVGEEKKIAETLLKIGFVVLVLPFHKPNGSFRRDISANAGFLDETIKNLDAFLKPATKPLQFEPKVQKVGLIGFSSVMEYCLAFSFNSSSKKVKGIFGLGPAFSDVSWPAKHPYFHFSGTEDDRSKLISWDLTNVLKLGIILDGGRHYGPLEMVEDPTLDKPYLGDRPLTASEQFKYLVDCLSGFFNFVFNGKDSFPEFYNTLKTKSDAVGFLYSNPSSKKILEGTTWEKNKFKLSYYWIGKVSSESQNGKISLSFNDRFLLWGAGIAITRYKQVNGKPGFKKIIRDFIKEIESSLENDLDLAKIDASAVVFLFKWLLNAPIIIKYPNFKQTNIPFDLPFTQEIKISLEKFVQKNSDRKSFWSEFEIQIKDFRAIKFLQNILAFYRRTKIDPWRHAVYGRELSWDTKNQVYQIPLKKIKVSEFNFLSLRLGQSYISRKKYNKNQPGMPQILHLYFNKRNSTFTEISIPPPFKREQEYSGPLQLNDPELYLYGDWLPRTGLQCYLTHHLIPLPPDLKTLHKIELHFQNPSGAIMLSEVALTN